MTWVRPVHILSCSSALQSGSSITCATQWVAYCPVLIIGPRVVEELLEVLSFHLHSSLVGRSCPHFADVQTKLKACEPFPCGKLPVLESALSLCRMSGEVMELAIPLASCVQRDHGSSLSPTPRRMLQKAHWKVTPVSPPSDVPPYSSGSELPRSCLSCPLCTLDPNCWGSKRRPERNHVSLPVFTQHQEEFSLLLFPGSRHNQRMIQAQRAVQILLSSCGPSSHPLSTVSDNLP